MIRAYDPIISSLPGVEGVELYKSPEEAMIDASAVFVVTGWPEFRNYDWAHLCSRMRAPVLVDGRNTLSGVGLPHDVIYVPIGRHFERQGAAVGRE